MILITHYHILKLKQMLVRMNVMSMYLYTKSMKVTMYKIISETANYS